MGSSTLLSTAIVENFYGELSGISIKLISGLAYMRGWRWCNVSATSPARRRIESRAVPGVFCRADDVCRDDNGHRGGCVDDVWNRSFQKITPPFCSRAFLGCVVVPVIVLLQESTFVESEKQGSQHFKSPVDFRLSDFQSLRYCAMTRSFESRPHWFAAIRDRNKRPYSAGSARNREEMPKYLMQV